MKKIYLRVLTLLISLLISPCSFTASAADIATVSELSVSFDDTYPVFELGGDVNFNFAWVGTVSNDSLVVTVEDYSGSNIFNETYCVNGEKVTVNLKNAVTKLGWYYAVATLGESTVSVGFSVVTPLVQRRDTSNSVLGFNAFMAQSSTVAKDSNNIENPISDKDASDYIRTVKLAGVNRVREGVLQRYFVPDDTRSYPTMMRNAYRQVRDYYRNSGIKADIMYHTAYDPTNKYSNEIPNELVKDAYGFAKELAGYYDGVADTVEIWNEADLVGNKYAKNSESPDKFASFYKAAAIGALDAGTDVKVMFGGFAGYNKSYIKRFLSNDVSEFSDIYNYHDYSANTGYTGDNLFTRLSLHQSLADEYGFANKEIRNTEFGKFFYDCADESGNINIEEQKNQARYDIKASIYNLANGADFSYYFLHGKYNDGVLGDIDSFGNMKRTYSAISAFTNALGNCKYYGVLNGLPSSAEGYVFYDNAINESVVCLWSTSKTSVNLKLDADSVTHIDFMGNSNVLSSVNGSYSVMLGEDAVYLRLKGKVPLSLAADSSLTAPSGNSQIDLTDAQRIVIMQEFASECGENAKTNAYTLNPNIQNTVTLHITNLNNTSKTGKIYVKSFGGWQPEQNVKNVTIPAMGTADVSFTLACEAEAGTSGEVPLIFCGNFDGEWTSVSESMIQTSDVLQAQNPTAGADNFNNWKVNKDKDSSASITGVNGEVRFDTKFSSGGWSFPIFNVDEGTYSGTDGIMLSYNSVTEVNDVNLCVYVTEKNGSMYRCSRVTSLSGEYKQFFFSWDDFEFYHYSDDNDVLNPESIVDVRLGISVSEPLETVLSLKNFGAYTAADVSTDVEISYVAPGASNLPQSERINFRASKVSSIIPEKKGYVFCGWSESPVSNDVDYLPGDFCETVEDLTLYAVWKQIISVPYRDMVLFDKSSARLVVKGNVGAVNAGMYVTCVLSAGNDGNLFSSPNDILFMGESRADSFGNYVFEITPAKTVSDNATVYLGIDGEIKFTAVVPAVDACDWLDAAGELKEEDGKLLLCSTVVNFCTSDVSCDIYAAFYDSDGNLIDCEKNNFTAGNGVSDFKKYFDFKADLKNTKIFFWSPDKIKPLTEALEYSK